VEDLRSCLQGKLKQKARETAPLDGGMATKGEGIDIPAKQEDKKTNLRQDLTKVQAG
jgi:hypothetical protein